MNAFIKYLAFISIILLTPIFSSCEDEPDVSNVYEETIGRGRRLLLLWAACNSGL